MLFLISLFTTLFCCPSQSSFELETIVYNDTSSHKIESGFYLVGNDSIDVAFRKLTTISKDYFENGQMFALKFNDFISFSILDSVYTKNSTNPDYYDIYLKLSTDGQNKFYALINKANDKRYLDDHGRPSLGIVLNNVLILKLTILSPFEVKLIKLKGPFDDQAAYDLKRQIDIEIKKSKNSQK